ncbi:MAG: EF-hand domain-containing protein [Alphaproteobacteria bacterium]
MGAQAADAGDGLLAELEQRFQGIAGSDGVIDRDEFRKALSLNEDYYADRLFAMVDSDASGSVALPEFLSFVRTLVDGTEDDRLRFAFRLHDPDDSGAIDRDELARIIRASIAQNGIELPEVAVAGLTDALFRRADADGEGSIGFDEFRAVLDAYPKLKRQMTLSATTWLQRRPAAASRSGPSLADRLGDWLGSLGRRIANNRAATVVLVLYAAANVALFANAVHTYAGLGANVYVQIARGCGACLNFNGALILIPMLRHLLTWLRQTVAGGLLPVDDSIAFHKLVGHAMFALAGVHTLAHFANYTTLPGAFGSYLFGTSAGLTGLLLSITFIVMWVCALDVVRRRGHFELFYFTHFGFVLWFLFALLHGPVFWQWATLPILGYVAERLIRMRRTSRPMPVQALEPLPSGVTRMELQLPPGFRYRPGDYVFLRYPPVSAHEWHPFTVTTCPEETGRLSVHVRGLGNWTRRLHDLAKRRRTGQISAPTPDPAYIDGPYGTPSTHIFHARVAVLIGAGIGVTPFAAILKSLFLRRAAGDTDVSVEKAHFIWMNRDQYSFEWFADMLGGLEAQDPERRLLDVQIYLTGVGVDMTSATLDVAMDVYQAETGRDLFTGLRNRTNLGRPDWPAIFRRIADEHAGTKVDVYFCGPPALATVLSGLAAKHGFGYHKENF